MQLISNWTLLRWNDSFNIVCGKRGLLFVVAYLSRENFQISRTQMLQQLILLVAPLFVRPFCLPFNRAHIYTCVSCRYLFVTIKTVFCCWLISLIVLFHLYWLIVNDNFHSIITRFPSKKNPDWKQKEKYMINITIYSQ